MKRLTCLGVAFLLLGCTTSKEPPPPVEHDWASPLSADAQAFIHTETKQYHRCLIQAMKKQTGAIKDSRDTTQLIVSQCEAKLTPIRERLLAESMPTQIADRYLRKKRVQATRKILRQVMYMQSQNQQ